MSDDPSIRRIQEAVAKAAADAVRHVAEGRGDFVVEPERVQSLKRRGLVALRRTVSARPADFNALAKEIIPKLAEHWHMSAEELTSLMGDVQADRDLTEDQFLRLSALVGIYKALHVWFSEPLANEWPKRPNDAPMFNGRCPLDVMIEGGADKILETRLHLDDHRPWTIDEIEKAWGIKTELPPRSNRGQR